MTYNATAMQDLVRQILAELGENPDREGLLATPRRVEKSLKFLTSGYTVDIERSSIRPSSRSTTARWSS